MRPFVACVAASLVGSCNICMKAAECDAWGDYVEACADEWNENGITEACENGSEAEESRTPLTRANWDRLDDDERPAAAG